MAIRNRRIVTVEEDDFVDKLWITKIGGVKVDRLDSRVYYGLKDAIRKAVKNIGEDNLDWGHMPIILVDFQSWEVFYFDDKHEAQEHVENHNTYWDDSPPDGEDEDLVLIKFCIQGEKERYPSTYKNYKFHKEVNGKRIFREKSFVVFEPELVINVII